MMARQKVGRIRCLSRVSFQPRVRIRRSTVHAGSRPSAPRRFARLVDRGLGAVVVLGLHAGRPGATFPALAGLDANTVVIVSRRDL